MEKKLVVIIAAVFAIGLAGCEYYPTEKIVEVTKEVPTPVDPPIVDPVIPEAVCQPGETLVDGTCQVDPPPSANVVLPPNPVTCQANETLVDGVCVPPPTVVTCQPNETLINDVCRARCTTNTDCSGGMCLQNACFTQQEVDDMYEAFGNALGRPAQQGASPGQSSSEQNVVYLNPSNANFLNPSNIIKPGIDDAPVNVVFVPREETTSCDADNPCPAGQRCQYGVCLNSNEVLAGEEGSFCNNLNPCRSGLECNEDHQCEERTDPGTGGSYCTETLPCSSGFACVNHRCMESGPWVFN